MRVTVLHFGPLREARGLSEETVELPDGLTAEEALRALHPSIGALPVAFAVDAVRVPGGTVLHDGAHLALLPPVGGG